MTRFAVAAAALAATAFAGPIAVRAAEPAEVLATYSDIAAATYGDALATALGLQVAVSEFLAQPTEARLETARTAWRAARPSYQQSEAYRFGNPIVDDWEGRVNAWPLDEGLIDYVSEAYGRESDANAFYTLNIIANAAVTAGGETVDATTIDADLLRTLQEIGGVEANVAIGYHAIEFLLWGQDLNGTGPGAGARPATDFDIAACTSGHCDRRGAYLAAATDLLVADLTEMAANWTADGAARRALLDGDAEAGLAAIVTGLGSLSYGELAGERMKLGLLLHDPEEEHDCFSDNTFNSHYYDVLGLVNVYSGSYTRIDGSVIGGPSLSELVRDADPALAAEMTGKLQATLAAAAALKQRGETVEAYDQMLAEGNVEGNAAVQAVIDGLIDQTRSIERVVAVLGLDNVTIERSDSLDNPNAVFQ